MRPATLLLLTFLLTTAIAACGRHAIKSPVEVAPPPPPPEKTGPLDSDEMRTTIEANLAKLNACHDAAKTHKRTEAAGANQRHADAKEKSADNGTEK